MKQCAVVLNGSDIISVSNLKRKYNKIISNSNMKILEECDKEDLEDRCAYWKNQYKSKDAETSDGIRLFHFVNPITGYTITSIYPELDKSYKDWSNYERVD